MVYIRVYQNVGVWNYFYACGRYYGPFRRTVLLYLLMNIKCEITCKPGVFDKISVSAREDPEEFRYVVRMFFQPRPL